MTESIFRQSALDKLAAPDRLDAPLQLVHRWAWLLLATLAAAVCGAALWASLTYSLVKVTANGVLMGAGGLSEIVSEEGGRIDRLLVATGQIVEAGQPIAQVYRIDLERNLAEARVKLSAAQDRYTRLSAFYAGQQSRDHGVDALRQGTIAQSRTALLDRARYLNDKLTRMRQLAARGFVPNDRLQEQQAELAEVRERIANLGEASARVVVDANTRSGEAELALLDERRIIDEQQRLIERLTAQLTEQRFVRASETGRVTEIKVGRGDVIGAGSPIATLAPTANGADIIGLLYVSVAEGKRIQPGMAAEIVPASTERAVYGHIGARVVSVGTLPATAEGMRRVLRNDALVEQLMGGGAPIEVRVALDRDSATASGYRWSASQGPRSAISVGSSLGGQVIVDRRRMIALLLPQVAD